MPGSLLHSPADVLRKMMVDLGLGSDPTPQTSAWPVYAATEPDSPDDLIAVFDRPGTSHGREQYSGEKQEHHGAQILIRARDHSSGYTKARAVAVAMDESVYQEVVIVTNESGTGTYLVHAINRTGDVQVGGLATPQSKRHRFLVDLIAAIRQTA